MSLRGDPKHGRFQARTLQEAVARSIREGNALRYEYGRISLDREGRIETGRTAGVDEVFYAWHDGKRISSFLD